MIYALVTVYQPGDEVADNIRCLAGQADLVYICDNSAEEHEALFSCCGENLRYCWFGENRGLSRAFNGVLKDDRIPWREEDFVLFFDQDSRIAPGHVQALLDRFDSVSRAGHPIGCLGPAYFNTSSGVVEMPRQRRLLAPGVYSVSGIITSSMLSTYGRLKQVGFWNENVFLDLADWDLCWRLQEQGLPCCLTDAVTLHHSVGRGERKLGPIRLREGEPFREYYQIRDSLYLMEERYTPFKYRVRFLAMLLIRSPLHILFLGNGAERMNYISLGIQDYRKRKKGPLSPARDGEEALP